MPVVQAVRVVGFNEFLRIASKMENAEAFNDPFRPLWDGNGDRVLWCHSCGEAEATELDCPHLKDILPGVT